MTDQNSSELKETLPTENNTTEKVSKKSLSDPTKEAQAPVTQEPADKNHFMRSLLSVLFVAGFLLMAIVGAVFLRSSAG